MTLSVLGIKPEPTPIDSNEDVLAPTPIIEEGNAPDSNVWDDLPLPSPTPIPIDTSPNIINIDFEELARNEDNETIRTLHKYFANELPTYKNEYTGMFEGYNLIMITAEGFFPMQFMRN